MIYTIVKTIIFLILFVGSSSWANAQELLPQTKASIEHYLNKVADQEQLTIGAIRIDSALIRGRQICLFANDNCAYIPFRKKNVADIYAHIRSLLPDTYAKYELQVIADKHPIEHLIMGSFAAPKQRSSTNIKPLITNISRPYNISKGLQNRHIALWQSHGYYFEAKLNRWEWQRARIFQTVEDLYTQAYVLPYLVPMLENAGANVLIPRERDTQSQEVIVDQDKGRYDETLGQMPWQDGELKGFAHKRKEYIEHQNPFEEGSYRQVATIKKGNPSLCSWIPHIPQAGSYAVYISYKSLSNSTDDALYTVHHRGGETQFKINQTMGGGTWIYLGHFAFDKGCSPNGSLVVSNVSSKNNRVLTADAVKFGGGYGNIARRVSPDLSVSDNKKSSDDSSATAASSMPAIDYPYQISNYPRYTEGARYWLQWAGMPDSVYNLSQGKNDYTDDYQSRAQWVNYISGGSSKAPLRAGLKIPIDLAFAFHTDAGTTMNDSTIGTLGIFYTDSKDAVFSSKVSRYASRDLCDYVQTQIVDDIRALYEPQWTRRGMWNKAYYEASRPDVPTMLLELLSHQNLADMRYGLDPGFRFSVSRSIYKGILRFLSTQNNVPYIVQPLPPDNFALQFVSDSELNICWKPQTDSLEPSAIATKYRLYTRIGDADFDGGTIVSQSHCKVQQEKGVHYSYKVTAINEGGESFSSEILSAYRAINEKGRVMIINGFDRLSGPASFASPDSKNPIAGFSDALDYGVPDRYDISYIGSQREFRRNIPWMDDDAPGFGASHANFETQVIAGNSFDYPIIHGKAIAAASYSYTSASRQALMSGSVELEQYPIVDIILGKQRQTGIGRAVYGEKFKTFPQAMQDIIKGYCQQGGSIIVSGAYVASDLWDRDDACSKDKSFAMDVLKYQWRTQQAAVTGRVKSVASPFAIAGSYAFNSQLNDQSYIVEAPDGIEPAGEGSHTIFRYSENNISAGIAFAGQYKTCILGFPIEALKTEKERIQIMQSIISFISD
ncbi:xanthan lyase [Bacteroidales bacterium]|nr:xanthan lyase [Bacteroidales bacterium]